VKIFGLSVLAAIAGYLIGLFGGMFVVETFSSNVHDKSMEAAMTGAFVFGPLMALVAAIATVIYCLRRRTQLP
jgi:Na+/proline symporter